MKTAADQVMDLIFGHCSQTLFAGTELGIFDHLDREMLKTPDRLAATLALIARFSIASFGRRPPLVCWQRTNCEPSFLRRWVICSARRIPSLSTPWLGWRKDRNTTICPRSFAMANRTPSSVRPHGVRQRTRESGLRRAVQAGDDELLGVQSSLVLDALRGYDFSRIRTFCDVAGGYGHLMCAVLRANPDLAGIVLDLPEDVEELWATKLALQQRCQYVAGDMFEAVPTADAYSLKMILHDWSDEECVEILSNVRKAATGAARVFIIEHVVPEHNVPHFAKLFDIHMMCWGDRAGKDRAAV